ncbi:ABC transporter, ATP-binding protein [Bacteroidetes bacterium oral taxon 272 str. F0290]|nr:ABC transporter, ATP-binding protein [Bacteroidetes bacterium oral taxon 272 str. F0290]
MSILELRHIVKTYPNGTYPKMVLDNISCELRNFGVIGLLGKNGAGKSTLIKCCTGLVDYEGDILYKGVNLKSIQKKKAGPNYYSALFEGNRNIYWKLTPVENIQYFSALRGIKYRYIQDKANYLLDILNLSSHKNTLIERLSRGMQQKVAIAMALCFNTPVTFLDEPTLGLDVESRDCLISYLKDFNQNAKEIIIISSHDLDFISEVSNEILLLKDGKLINSQNMIRQVGFRLTANSPIPILNKYLTSSKNNRFIYNEIIDIADVFIRLSPTELQCVISVENLNMDIESLYYSNIQ